MNRKNRHGTGKRRPDVLKAAEKHRQAGRFKEALASCRLILKGEPENFAAHMCLARMSLDLGRLESAASMVLRALSTEPGSEDGQGLLKQVTGQIEDPQAQAQVLVEYAQILKGKGMIDAALLQHRRALRLNPARAAHDTQESLALLAKGDLKNGWPAYEWRNTIGSLGAFTDKVWAGEPLAGKTVLVWGEQGIGDQIMFSTCLPDIIRQAGHVILAIDERLTTLFSRSFPEASVHGATRFGPDGKTSVHNFQWLESFPPVDCFVMMGSLPRFIRQTIDRFPTTANQMVADPLRVEYWRQQIGGKDNLKKVGIAWRSIRESDDRIYPGFNLWRPLFGNRALHFVNLQAGMHSHEEQVLKQEFGLDLDVMEELDLVENIDDMAALICSLDGVVTTLTSVQWLAAAMGVPVWSVARAGNESQEMLLGEDRYPWFPALNICLSEDDAILRRAFEDAGNAITMM